MSDVVIVAMIAGGFSLLGSIVAIIPTVIANRKKTQESIKESNAETDKRIAKLQTSFDVHVREYEAAKASSQRYRILRFYDEICEGRRHSESHFEDILQDIDEYETYCSHHEEYRNNRGHVAMAYIKDEYARAKAGGSFLTHKKEDVA